MTTILVWYFLTAGAGMAGPFSSQAECERMQHWAEINRRNFYSVSACWQAPLADIKSTMK